MCQSKSSHLFSIIICLIIATCYCPDSATMGEYSIISGSWVTDSGGHVPSHAVSLSNGSNHLYVCRAVHNRNLIAGSLSRGQPGCLVSWGGHSFQYSPYEVLVNRNQFNLKWSRQSNGYIRNGAIIGGVNNGWTQYICRVNLGTWHLGRVDPNDQGNEDCSVPYDGERNVKDYEVLYDHDYHQ